MRQTPKRGERWVPKSGGPGGFTVVDEEPLVVEVDRFVSGDLQIRRRTVTTDSLPFFIAGYERQTSPDAQAQAKSTTPKRSSRRNDRNP